MSQAATYSESAANVMITWERARIELRNHGVSDASELATARAEIPARMPKSDGGEWLYEASAVLRWLGY